MSMSVEQRLQDEIGTLHVEAPEAVALLYPSPYSVGMSSLGFQTIYRSINETPGRAAHRAFLPDELLNAKSLHTSETGRPVGN